MKTTTCLSCGLPFQKRPQVPNQMYCADASCQLFRRKKWQSQKIKVDPDYRDNQARAQQEWKKRNPNYWRDYRHAHPEYVQRNRAKQRERTQKKRNNNFANMDASDKLPCLPSGVYELSLLSEVGTVKMGVWTVKIILQAYRTATIASVAKDDA
jgi:hypothetical protein